MEPSDTLLLEFLTVWTENGSNFITSFTANLAFVNCINDMPDINANNAILTLTTEEKTLSASFQHYGILANYLKQWSKDLIVQMKHSIKMK